MDDTSILPRAFGAIKAFEPLHPPPASGPASRRLTRPPPLYVYPLPDNAGGQPQLSSHGFARRPSAATGTSTPLQASPVSLVPGATDSESICSGSCSGCCEEEACKDECLESCAGFIDCDDAELCTSPDCVEVGCLDDAPPCFDKDCVPHLTAAANLAAPSLLRHDQFSPQSILPRTGLPQLDMMAFSPQSEPASATTASSSHLDFFDPSFANRYASGIVNAPMAKGPRGILSCGYDYTAAGGSNMSTRSPVRPSHAPEDTSMPVDYVGDALHSQWGGNCGGEFFDWNALDEHILSNHVKPQNEVQCRWDDCQRATDPSSLTTHVLNDHQPSLQGMQQACRWSQCTLTVPGPEELVSHLRTTHMPANALHCQWDLCGALADDASDLLAHLQTDHLLDPAAVSTKMSGEMGLLPEATSASAPRKCRWDHVSKAGSECGQICADAISLQQHIKEVHISHLNKQLGFVCKWAECRRRTSGSFGQKGKLERHIQVHTGCEFDVRSGIKKNHR